MTTDKNGHEITSEDVRDLEYKLDIAVKALEYVQSLASKVGENWGELVYVEFDIIGDALKEIQQ